MMENINIRIKYIRNQIYKKSNMVECTVCRKSLKDDKSYTRHVKTKTHLENQENPKPIQPYCGIKEPIPKNKRRGNMKECALKNQIKYYGAQKVDKKIVELAVKKKEPKITKEKAMLEIAKMNGRKKRLESLIESPKEVDNKNTNMKELAKTKEELIKWKDIYNAFLKK